MALTRIPTSPALHLHTGQYTYLHPINKVDEANRTAFCIVIISVIQGYILNNVTVFGSRTHSHHVVTIKLSNDDSAKLINIIITMNICNASNSELYSPRLV